MLNNLPKYDLEWRAILMSLGYIDGYLSAHALLSTPFDLGYI